MDRNILGKILDDAPDVWEDLHVFPINDLLQHSTEGTECMCDPKIEVHGAKLIIIHNSYDGRE